MSLCASAGGGVNIDYSMHGENTQANSPRALQVDMGMGINLF